jgi:hypothetical protein
MMNMIHSLLILAAAGCFSALMGYSQNRVDDRTNIEGYPTSRHGVPDDSLSLKDLSRMETKQWKARVTGKADSIKELVSNDAKIVTCTGAANKKEWIARVETGECKVRTFHLNDFALILSTPTAATITYHAEQDATCNGKPLARDLSVSATYQKYNGTWGKWQSVSHEERATPAFVPDRKP